MARLKTPKTTAFIAGLCKSAGVKLREFKSPEQFEKEVIRFIENNDMVYLATSRNDIPRCTPLGYYSQGTTLYILTEGGGKLVNLKANDRFSYAIGFRPNGQQGIMKVAGLQCWGRATVLSMKKDPEQFGQLMQTLGVARNLEAQGAELPPFHYRFIKLVPYKIRFLNLGEGINNVTWSR